jgi:MFS transporter, DHA1 family, multidrug resistance protein
MTLSGPAIALLCLISGFLPLVTDGFLAAIRPIMIDFQIPVSSAQTTISTVLLGCASTQLFVGAYADRYGRRPVLTAAIVVFLIASLGLSVAPTLPWLLLCRFIQGASGAAGPILARAIVRDVYDRPSGARVLSIIGMGLALVPLLVPTVNAVIVAYAGWRASAVLYVIVLAVALAMTRLCLPETLRGAPNDRSQWRAIRDASRAASADRRVVGYILCCVTGYAGLAVWISASPHLLEGWFGRPAALFGFYWSTTIVSYVVGGWASVWSLRRASSDRILARGSLILVAAAALLIVGYVMAPRSLTLFLLGVCTYNFGWSMLQPNAQTGALAPFTTSAGRVSALLGFLQLTCGAAVAQTFGRLHDGTTLAAVGMISAAAVLNALVRYRWCPVQPASTS